MSRLNDARSGGAAITFSLALGRPIPAFLIRLPPKHSGEQCTAIKSSVRAEVKERELCYEPCLASKQESGAQEEADRTAAKAEPSDDVVLVERLHCIDG